MKIRGGTKRVLGVCFVGFVGFGSISSWRLIFSLFNQFFKPERMDLLAWVCFY